MKKFKIEIKETLVKVIEINAENSEQAIETVKKMYKKEELILDDSNYIETEFKEIKR